MGEVVGSVGNQKDLRFFDKTQNLWLKLSGLDEQSDGRSRRPVSVHLNLPYSILPSC
jgi:hypothetical protein